MARNFIQETIDNTERRLKTLKENWEKFQTGEIDKDRFESKYILFLELMREDAEDEIESPNNGCKYHETCPTSEYFKQQKI